MKSQNQNLFFFFGNLCKLKKIKIKKPILSKNLKKKKSNFIPVIKRKKKFIPKSKKAERMY